MRYLSVIVLAVVLAGCTTKKVVVEKNVAVDSVQQYHHVDSVVIDSSKIVSKIDTSTFHYEYQEIVYDTERLDSAGSPMIKRIVNISADRQNRQSEETKTAVKVDEVSKNDSVISGKRQEVTKEKKDVKSWLDEIRWLLLIVMMALTTYFIIYMVINSQKHSDNSD